MPNGRITYLQRNAVDDQKWNACISLAKNGLLYAYTDYLDAMASNWDALVWEDYQAVMPLPWRKKWGLHYLYQPFLTAQLGVFGQNLSAELFKEFLLAVPKRFRYWDFSLNHANRFAANGFPLVERSNFVLSLNKPYADLYKAYRENIRRNVKKSTAYGCTVKTDVSISNVIELAKAQAPAAPAEDFQRFETLYQKFAQQGKAKTYGMLSANGDLLASAAFFFSHNRAYYLLVGNHPNGRTLGASHALIDAFIKDYAGQNLLLDFEGSDIRNLQFFYSSFGAVEEKYAALLLNRLPWWAKAFKR